MLLQKYEPPGRMTTAYFNVKTFKSQATGEIITLGEAYSKRKVAILGENGKYCVRDGIQTDIRQASLSDLVDSNPFSVLHSLKDKFTRYAGFTKTFPEALAELVEFETEYADIAGKKSIPKDATHISKIPVLRSIIVAALPGNHFVA